MFFKFKFIYIFFNLKLKGEIVFYNKESGNIGENLACDYLIKNNYKIVKSNYKNKIGEIDIIALSPQNIYVFVEVKLRLNCNFGYPRQAINYKKQQKIKATALSYLKYNNLLDKVSIRFDCIEIIGDKLDYTLNHLTNIF